MRVLVCFSHVLNSVAGRWGSHFHGKAIAGPFGHELVRWSGQGKGVGRATPIDVYRISGSRHMHFQTYS